MTSLLQILLLALDIARWIVLAHVIMSWLINFQVLNLRQPLVAQIWDVLQRTLNPLYSRVRRFIPAMGGIDFAPLVVLFAIIAIKIVIINNFVY
ncbi:MAG: YggT family protein [Paracoccaceae bacterium]